MEGIEIQDFSAQTTRIIDFSRITERLEQGKMRIDCAG